MEQSASNAIPQMFSRDYCVRVPQRRLGDILFEHLCTEQDPGVSGLRQKSFRGGMTEWVGRCGGQAVSLGWDWGQLEDGSICLLKAVSPRTNLMAIDAKGYDMPGNEALDDLWALIESLPWRGEVAASLRSLHP
ncbi:hypothetical protein GCM10027034_36460 [Ramlibacter solisilvae]|nr:DUF4902 domain-containing protein [Ramlibacter tataouinensis]